MIYRNSRRRREVWSSSLCDAFTSFCSPPLCEHQSVLNSVLLSEYFKAFQGFLNPKCVFVCTRAHNKEMDIYISSWLIFSGLSLMVLCPGAELLLLTYFMTSCAPRVNNSASLLSTFQRLPSPTLCVYVSLFSITLFLLAFEKNSINHRRSTGVH